MRSIKKLAFLDRFYKKCCCGAKNHPSGWKKEKHINQKITRKRLKDATKRAESEDKERNYDIECRNHSEMILNAQKARNKE